MRVARHTGWGVLALLLAAPACFLFDQGTCLENVHPSWHACYQKSGCDTAWADADGGPASKQDGGTQIVCGCCDE